MKNYNLFYLVLIFYFFPTELKKKKKPKKNYANYADN